jgi:hypothetical protein
MHIFSEITDIHPCYCMAILPASLNFQVNREKSPARSCASLSHLAGRFKRAPMMKYNATTLVFHML